MLTAQFSSLGGSPPRTRTEGTPQHRKLGRSCPWPGTIQASRPHLCCEKAVDCLLKGFGGDGASFGVIQAFREVLEHSID